ncbi:unnamed protein product [Mucor fragilis]
MPRFLWKPSKYLTKRLICEKKPKNKKSTAYFDKADFVRSSTLKYWSILLLPYQEYLAYIESTSCHFNRLALRVQDTKLIDSRLMHLVKKEASIPNLIRNKLTTVFLFVSIATS